MQRATTVAQRNLPLTTGYTASGLTLKKVCYSYTKEYSGVLDHAKAPKNAPSRLKRATPTASLARAGGHTSHHTVTKCNSEF